MITPVKENLYDFHPGATIKHDYLEPLKVSTEEFSEKLQLGPKFATALLEGQAAVTPDIADRLAQLFDTTSEFWTNLQDGYDKRAAEIPSISPNRQM